MSQKNSTEETTAQAPEVHTELRPSPTTAEQTPGLKPRTPLDMLPEPPLGDDAVEDLFNDMPV